jgi:hypothetical protein
MKNTLNRVKKCAQYCIFDWNHLNVADKVCHNIGLLANARRMDKSNVHSCCPSSWTVLLWLVAFLILSLFLTMFHQYRYSILTYVQTSTGFKTTFHVEIATPWLSRSHARPYGGHNGREVLISCDCANTSVIYVLHVWGNTFLFAIYMYSLFLSCAYLSPRRMNMLKANVRESIGETLEVKKWNLVLRSCSFQCKYGFGRSLGFRHKKINKQWTHTHLTTFSRKREGGGSIYWCTWGSLPLMFYSLLKQTIQLSIACFPFFKMGIKPYRRHISDWLRDPKGCCIAAARLSIVHEKGCEAPWWGEYQMKFISKWKKNTHMQTFTFTSAMTSPLSRLTDSHGWITDNKTLYNAISRRVR